MWYALPAWQVLRERLHPGLQKMHKSQHLLPVDLSSLGTEKKLKLKQGGEIIEDSALLSSMGKMGSRSGEERNEGCCRHCFQCTPPVCPEVVSASESLRTEVRTRYPP